MLFGNVRSVPPLFHLYRFVFSLSDIININRVSRAQVDGQERDQTMALNNIERDDIRGLEDFLSRHKKHLRPNHASLIEVDILGKQCKYPKLLQIR